MTSRRDLDAPKRAPENLDPKTRTPGLAPSIFSKVDASRNAIAGVFGDPQNIRICVGSETAKSDKHKKSITSLSATNKNRDASESEEREKNSINVCHSEQTNKKSDKKNMIKKSSVFRFMRFLAKGVALCCRLNPQHVV